MAKMGIRIKFIEFCRTESIKKPNFEIRNWVFMAHVGIGGLRGNWWEFYLTTLSAHEEEANASGFALKTKPMLRIYPIASLRATLDSKDGSVLMSA